MQGAAETLPTSEGLLALQGQAAAIAQRVIDGVAAEQMAAPTPCAEWDVAAVINHLVVGNMMVAALARGEAPPDREARVLGADPAADFAASARAADAALRAEGAMERRFRLPFGEVSGTMLVGMRFVDVLIHAWDLAKATGQPSALDPALCRTALAMAEARFGDGPRRPGTPFGPPVELAADAPVCDRFAAFLGRRP